MSEHVEKIYINFHYNVSMFYLWFIGYYTVLISQFQGMQPETEEKTPQYIFKLTGDELTFESRVHLI